MYRRQYEPGCEAKFKECMESFIPQQNAQILLELVRIEKIKSEKLKEMVEQVKAEVKKRQQGCINIITSLKEANDRLKRELEERKRIVSDNALKDENQDKLYKELDESISTNETARERYKILKEIQYWEQKCNEIKVSETSKQLKQELENIKKTTKKYKAEYLNLKQYSITRDNSETKHNSPATYTERVRPPGESNRSEYGVKRLVNKQLLNNPV